MAEPTGRQDEDRQSFTSYLEDMDRWPYPPEGVPLSGPEPRYPGWRGFVLKVIRGPLLLSVRMSISRVIMAVRRERTLEPRDGVLKLHLGCGDLALPGWTNVDLAGSKADFIWDLRKPLPILPGTVTAVFNEHFLEHLPLPAAMSILTQCHKLMAPGGIIRVGVPDFRLYFEDYVSPAGLIDNARPARPTALVALNELVYSYGHLCLWDVDTLTKLFSEIGFVDIHEAKMGDSALDPVPDQELRSQYGPTLYIEAVKPPGENV